MPEKNPIDILLAENIKLPSPPAIAVRILEAVRAKDASFHSLAEIIAADPALTAKILSIANSAVYGLTSKVTNVEHALGVLGVNTLKNIALSFVIAKEMKGGEGQGFDFDHFWKRSVTGAVAAELISKQVGHKQTDIFVTALLQDIGCVILAMCRLDDYLSVMDAYRVGEAKLCVLEQQRFGFDHQALGAAILAKWGLPENIIDPIRHHHQPLSAPDTIRAQVQLLNLADRVCAVYHGNHSVQDIQQFKQDMQTFFQVEIKEPEALIDAVANQSVEILKSFELDASDIKPYSQILMEANEQLGALNLSYEQLVMELKQAKEQAEALATGLKEANEKLREMASRDGLTGLYNHRYFQELMDTEVSRAARYQRPFALVMFDIDHFKNVNDTYGHPAGDAVLIKIGALIQEAVRTSDFAARYGGEEFTVILTETPVRNAVIFAERLRRGVEEMEVETGEHTLKVTISLGVTGFVPGENNPTKQTLIEAADKAMYVSKDKGRNQINIILQR